MSEQVQVPACGHCGETPYHASDCPHRGELWTTSVGQCECDGPDKCEQHDVLKRLRIGPTAVDAARAAEASQIEELREQLKAKADGSTPNDDLPFGGYKRVVWQLEAELETLRAVRTEFRKRAEAAEARVAALSAQVRDWIAANAPGGWIDDLRKQVEQLTQEKADALKLAAEATNGWACYAKRDIEHREIARLHAELAQLRQQGEWPHACQSCGGRGGHESGCKGCQCSVCQQGAEKEKA